MQMQHFYIQVGLTRIPKFVKKIILINTKSWLRIHTKKDVNLLSLIINLICHFSRKLRLKSNTFLLDFPFRYACFSAQKMRHFWKDALLTAEALNTVYESSCIIRSTVKSIIDV